MVMKAEFYRVATYITHRLRSIPSKQLHSPFLFDVSQRVLKGNDLPEKLSRIEAFRDRLQLDHSEFEFNEAGAGRKGKILTSRRVSEIARHSLLHPSWAARLYRLARHSGAKRILELGTSLGVTTQYLASAGNEAQVITVEADAGSSEIAKRGFENNGFTNIALRNQTFSEFFERAESGEKFDLIYLDGDHRGENTLRYVRSLLELLPPKGILVMDDIHWSPEMSSAWAEVSSLPDFAFSLDLWKQGWLFRREMTEKQHFVVRP